MWTLHANAFAASSVSVNIVRRSGSKSGKKAMNLHSFQRCGVLVSFTSISIISSCTPRRPDYSEKVMNVLLHSMPDSSEHTPSVSMRMPNGALSSLAGNVDSHHRIAVADLILA
jgi:hypothetical protein